MILADKIINERKRNGWSQEEFADMLGVSRQAVSKWEGAQSTPDIQRIIQMAELFGVSTDYLLKEEIELPEVTESDGREFEGDNSKRLVSMEEANAFLCEKEKAAPIVARSVVLCILSPALLILLSGLTEMEGSIIKEAAAAGIGVVALLLLVAVAVYSFVVVGSRLKEYEFLEKEEIDTAYGVTGMVKERKKNFASLASSRTALGVIMCIICPVPLLVTAIMEAPDYIVCSMVSVLLVIVSAGVYLLVRVGTINNSYDMLLQENDYSVSKKRFNNKLSPIASIYWSLALAGYLAWSFLTNNWQFTWVVWPIAGVLFGVVTAIANVVIKEK